MIRLLSIQPHFDDWEFTTSATWMAWRRRGVDLTGQVIVVTDGGIGHHGRDHAETAAARLQEGQRSADLAGCNLLLLRDEQGTTFREATLDDDIRLRSALWNAVVSYKPDLLFCPPLPNSPTAGCHNDHYAVAMAVWRAAYLFAVPRAFDNYPPNYDRVKPAILCTDDAYLRPDFVTLAVEITEALDAVAELAQCHVSQVYEWLPWIGQSHPPKGIDDLRERLRNRYRISATRLGWQREGLFQFFIATSWGRALTDEERALFLSVGV
ncbi:MAG: hypothetical protein COS85_04160 [Armatimonadetes bacterium CG07_land_8_20_14_0_80_59_28]|nr:MAG: hypothetical protein COS85_04160 [Armatimonadetes bacterium CG07_land_8_20_14_0_80_59_28]PIX46159.1 MAG: hypothetical protein COZ56_00095 [Armatimonadetes bacterium CG_4_8_14_3_um_filter_58_9]PJB77706.1 MAG: hypothetical protein CO095_01280 [Armatimonadetes bacterium CG_4_9_14_3_um_filter_58_7]